jgi:alpha-1,3-glucosyltransferase
MAVLPTVSPKGTLLATLAVYAPLVSLIWRRPEPRLFPVYVALGNAAAFAAGWHVHEKAILGVTIPLLVAALQLKDGALAYRVAVLDIVANFSLLPLLPRHEDLPLKWILFGLAFCMDAALAKAFEPLKPLPRYLLVYAVVGFYAVCVHDTLFRGRMEFLPLLLISCSGAVGILTLVGGVYVWAAAFERK